MIDKEYEEKFQEWIDDCPIDFNQIGYQKNRLKGTFLKYGGCLSPDVSTFLIFQ